MGAEAKESTLSPYLLLEVSRSFCSNNGWLVFDVIIKIEGGRNVSIYCRWEWLESAITPYSLRTSEFVIFFEIIIGP